MTDHRPGTRGSWQRPPSARGSNRSRSRSLGRCLRGRWSPRTSKPWARYVVTCRSRSRSRATISHMVGCARMQCLFIPDKGVFLMPRLSVPPALPVYTGAVRRVRANAERKTGPPHPSESALRRGLSVPAPSVLTRTSLYSHVIIVLISLFEHGVCMRVCVR